MPIPTEPIGSIPRPAELLAAMHAHAAGTLSAEQLKTAEQSALRDMIAHLEETGSPIITDGEQTEPSFATYPLSGLDHLESDGVVIPFADGHTRQLPKLTAGPFRYGVHALTYLKAAQQYSHRPVKQAEISAAALSLLYPQTRRDAFAGPEFVVPAVAAYRLNGNEHLVDSVNANFEAAAMSEEAENPISH
jgi:5-methyltetrahydropteroyltriglutamate--homocysteine methyltransferase